MDTDTDILADFRARIVVRMSVMDACTRLQNNTLGASLKSVSV